MEMNSVNEDDRHDPYYDGYSWAYCRTKHVPAKNPEWIVSYYQLRSKGSKVNFFRKEFRSKVKGPGFIPYKVYYYEGDFELTRHERNPEPHGNTKETPQKVQAKLRSELQGASPSQLTPKRPSGDSPREKKARRTLGFSAEDPGEFSGTTPEESPYLPPDQPVRQGFTRTDPAVKEKLSQCLKKGISPISAYRETVRACTATGGMERLGGTPRNPKEVYNLKQKLASVLSHDDIYSCYEFHREYPEILTDVNLGPSVVLVITNPNVVSHVNILLHMGVPLVFNYDTTFNIGPFFVSPLVFRHPLFKNNPIIPMFFMMHEIGITTSHTFLFQRLKILLPKIDLAKNIIITDREDAIRKSIRENLPSITHKFCWNHMRRNVGTWATTRYTQTIASTRKHQFLKLLQSKTREEYDTNIQKFKIGWDKAFTKYYTTYEEKDVINNAIFCVNELGIADPEFGITNNSSESFNHSLKTAIPNPFSNFEKTFVSVYFFISDFCLEIFRGLKGIGKYVLQEDTDREIIEEMIEAYDADYNDNIGGIDKINMLLEHGICENKRVDNDEGRPRTKEALANFFLKNGRCEWIPHRRCFIVSGLGNKPFVVNLATMSCSCVSQGSCSHLIAVLKGAGLYKSNQPLPRRKYGNLGKLYRSTVARRTGKKGAPVLRLPRNVISADVGTSITDKITKRKELTQTENKGTVVSTDETTDANEEPSEVIAGSTETEPETEADPKPVQTKKKFRFVKKVSVPAPVPPESESDFEPCQSTQLGYAIPETRFESVKKSLEKPATWESEILVSCLPTLTKKNAVTKILKSCSKHNQDLYFADICCLKTALKRTEITAIQHHEEVLGYGEYFGGEIIEKVLLRFMLQIKNEPDLLVLPRENDFYMSRPEPELEPEKLKNLGPQFIGKIYFLDNPGFLNWKLFVVDVSKGQLEVYDPLGSYELEIQQTKYMDNVLRKLNPSLKWTVCYPDAPRQDDSINCGLFVAYYFEVLSRGWDFDFQFDPFQYRNYVLKVISATCHIYDLFSENLCYICKRKDPPGTESKIEWIGCERCSKWRHKVCILERYPDLSNLDFSLGTFICPT